MDRLTIGIIGAGAMARRHLDVLRTLQDIEIVAASSRGKERLQKLAFDYHIPREFRDNNEMLETVKPDAVIVAVSAPNVYQVASTCIQHGVSALIEKPPGLTAEETRKLVQSSKKVEGQFMAGLNRRFYGIIQNANRLANETGGLVSVMVQYTENLAPLRAKKIHPPEIFEHWLAADAIHCIDLLRFFGGETRTVSALSSRWKTGDSYGALIRFRNKAIGHFIANLTSPGRWKAVLYGLDMRIDVCPLEEGRVSKRDGTVTELKIDEMDTKFKPGFYRQDNYFIDHVRRNMPIERPAANLEDALETMLLVETIANS